MTKHINKLLQLAKKQSGKVIGGAGVVSLLGILVAWFAVEEWDWNAITSTDVPWLPIILFLVCAAVAYGISFINKK